MTTEEDADSQVGNSTNDRGDDSNVDDEHQQYCPDAFPPKKDTQVWKL